MLSPEEILNHYSSQQIQKALLSVGREREAVGAFADGSYMKRPDTILYPKDIIERVKRGAVAFHCSVEHWTNPLQLSTKLSTAELDELRKSWDLIIDIDSKVKLEHGRAAAVVIVDFLKELGVQPTVKFSGRRGFHIAVSADAFPPALDFKSLSSRYPEAPRAICRFIKEKVKERIFEALVDIEGGVSALTSLLPSVSELNPYLFLEVEENWGSRHLFRAPYSLHSGTWLVSLPIRLFKLKSFSPEQAAPEKIKVEAPFLESKVGEGTELLLQALDWFAKIKPEPAMETKKPKGKFSETVPEQYFPPCIKRMLAGLPDGRKRSVFTIISFLQSVNWTGEQIEKRVMEWGRAVGLPERFVRTQLKWHSRTERLPPNCENDLFYKSIGLCSGEVHCASGCKNPVNDAIKGYLRSKPRTEKKPISLQRKK